MAPAVVVEGGTVNFTRAWAPATTVSAAVWVRASDPPTVALIVFTSALVELSVPVVWPEPLVVPAG